MTPFEIVYVGVIVAFVAFLSTMFIIVHSHVWVRGGYAGKNQILELPEVDRFIAHIVTEASLISTVLIVGLSPLVKSHLNYEFEPQFVWGIVSFGLGGGVYVALKKRHAAKHEEEHDKP